MFCLVFGFVVCVCSFLVFLITACCVCVFDCYVCWCFGLMLLHCVWFGWFVFCWLLGGLFVSFLFCFLVACLVCLVCYLSELPNFAVCWFVLCLCRGLWLWFCTF